MLRFKITKITWIISAILVNLLLWQNCAPSFQSVGDGSSQASKNSTNRLVPDKLTNLSRIDPVANFSRFNKIIKDNCVKCHGGANTEHPNIVKYANLNTLEDWVNHPHGLITGGEPTKSLLYRRLKNSKGVNDRAIQTMPKRKPALSEDQLQFIANFIYSIPKINNICKNHNPQPNKVALRRLTRTELKNSIKTILDIDYDFLSLPNVGGGVFGNSGAGQVTDQNYFDTYYTGVAEIANIYVNQSKNQNCFNQSGREQTECIANQLNFIAELSYRKELDQNDKNTFMNVINTLNNNSEFDYSAKDKLEAGLMAILTSPKFLYLIRNGNGSGLKSYNDFEVATRVSLALFKSTIDRDLWNLARDGKFTNPNEYEQVISDLLNNTSSHRTYAENILRGWLNIDKVKSLQVDQDALGISQNEFDIIASDMRNEPIEIVRDIVTDNKSVNDLISGNTRFLNQRLSNHYNINSNINGNNLQKFELPESSPYAGIGLLATTTLVSSSHPDRGSLIIRGLDVHTRFNCGIMGEAPESTPEIEAEELGPNSTERQIALAHTSSGACAGCHRAMDPYGIALGNFDALGRYNDKDRFGNKIDSTTTINEFNIKDHKGMSRAIAHDDNFKSCFTGVNLQYFTASQMDLVNSHSDYCESKNISNQLTGNKDNIRSLITNILSSDYFLKWHDNN